MKKINKKLIILGAGFSKMVNKNNVAQNELLGKIINNFCVLLTDWSENKENRNILNLKNIDIEEILLNIPFFIFLIEEFSELDDNDVLNKIIKKIIILKIQKMKTVSEGENDSEVEQYDVDPEKGEILIKIDDASNEVINDFLKIWNFDLGSEIDSNNINIESIGSLLDFNILKVNNNDFSILKYQEIKKSYSKILINCVNDTSLILAEKEINILKNIFLESDIIDFNWDRTCENIFGNENYNIYINNNNLIIPHRNTNTDEVLYPSFSRNFLEFESKKTEELIEETLLTKDKIIIFGISFNLEDSFILNLIFNAKRHGLRDNFQIIIFEYNGSGNKTSNYKTFLGKYMKKDKIKIINFKNKNEFFKNLKQNT